VRPVGFQAAWRSRPVVSTRAPFNMTYNFSATQNNGRIVSSVDGVTGENVSYAYDSLNRLIAASTSGTGGVQWGFSYSYDGFGNLTGKTVTKGTPPLVPTPPALTVDSNTNRVRLSGDYRYDLNENWLGAAGAPNTWNVENQLLSTGAVDGDGNPITYTYDPWGRRVLQFSASSYGPTGTLYFYSITGQRLATYSAGYPTQTAQLSVNMYFGKRKLVPMDRLGSVRYNSNGAIAYFPWGEERPRSDGTLTADGTDKFGTYFRDGFGQDYANARYYNSNMGRFWSPDPSGLKAAHRKRPISWNRYVYASDDPVNRIDPSGRDDDGEETEDGNHATGGSGTEDDPYTGYSTTAAGTQDGGPIPTTGAIDTQCFMEGEGCWGYWLPAPVGSAPQLPPGLDYLMNHVPLDPCANGGMGRAPAPSTYAALGSAAATAPASMLLELISFGKGLALDAQASGATTAYANYVFGVYFAAAGIPLSVTLQAAEAYGAIFAIYTGTAGPMDGFIPTANVMNITDGYDAEKAGTLCTH